MLKQANKCSSVNVKHIVENFHILPTSIKQQIPAQRAMEKKDAETVYDRQ